MPRPKLAVPRRSVIFYLEIPTLNKLDLLVMNPVTGRPRKGLKTDIANKLIKRLVECRQTGTTTIDVSDILGTLH